MNWSIGGCAADHGVDDAILLQSENAEIGLAEEICSRMAGEDGICSWRGSAGGGIEV